MPVVIQGLVECVSINWFGFHVKVPNSLNWVKISLGICDGWVTLSTGWGIWDMTPTWRCFGLSPIMQSNECMIHILPIFILTFGSNFLMCVVSLLSTGIFVDYPKVNYGEQCVVKTLTMFQYGWGTSFKVFLKCLTDGN